MPTLRHSCNMRFLFCIFGGLLFLFAGGSGARADDAELCNHSARDPDLTIPACTRLLLEGVHDGANVAGLYNNRGVAKAVKGDLDSAIKDFDAALDNYPNSIDALKNRGLVRKQQREYNNAINDFTRALQIKDNSPDILNLRGSVLLDKEEYDRAIGDFDKAISLDRKFVNAYINRGQAFYFKRDFDRAILDFNQAAILAPAEPLVYVNRAMAQIDKGDFKNAIADYDEAIRLDPKNAGIYSRRGEAWRLQGNLERALADHDLAIKRKATEEAYNNRALVHKDLGKFDKALADCDEAILLNPAYDLGYANRGLIRRLMGDLSGALRDLDKAVSLAPRSPVALVFRGDALRELGETGRALSDFDEAVRILPDFAAAYAGRGLTYEKKGDIIKAEEDFERAAKLPDNVDAALAKPAKATAKLRLAAIAAARLKAASQKAAPPQPATAPAKATADEALPDPGNRVALVIGNSAYRDVGSLPNPRRDAQAIEAAFRKIGFTTVVSAYDATRKGIIEALRKFQDKLEKADWGVIYYAGHGIEIAGENYLVPVDAKLAVDTDVEDEAIPLERLLRSMEGSKLRLRVIILDACRDNVFAKKMRRTLAMSRSVERGLARIEPDQGTIVFYATRDGQTAEDGTGEHSPFTQALLNNILTPRVEINMLFRKVRAEVMKLTARKQEPFYYGSLPEESFYFTVK
jgi:tetratricopeptide (TPR) repeat protein